MKKAIYVFARISSVILAVAAVLVCVIMLMQFKSTKETYESNVANSSRAVASQITAINDNEAQISKAKATIAEQSKMIAQMQTQFSSVQAEINKKSDYKDRKICYLTFDDGPSGHTLKILDILKQKNAKATFFVTANGVTKYMKNIVESGNQIALHTYSHDYEHIYSSTKNYFNDLDKIHDLVQKETGVDSKVIRFPGGSSNTKSKNYCKGIMSVLTKEVKKRGYQYFDWNCDSTDAESDGRPVDKLILNVNADSRGMQHLTVLMHDTNAKATTVQALPTIIDNLRKKGFEFGVLTIDTPAVHHGINN